jgi:hypothetical protein
MAKKPEIHTPMTQQHQTLGFAASGTPINAQGAAPAAKAPSSLQLVAANGVATAKQVDQTPPAATCKQCLTLSFYFDGTGNNLDADIGTNQQSNVARLFQSRLMDDPVLGRYSFYVYGLGTYFADIGDPGNTTFGKGMGAMGQPRLDWAFKKFDEALAKAVARAENPTNKIRFIKLNVFGFSRGATAARAFVRDIEKRCNVVGDSYKLKNGGHPIEVCFLGIFDTVASVGLPMSANTVPLLNTAGIYSLNYTLKLRANEQGQASNIINLAFSPEGADPAPGVYDGHATWADGLEVTPLVKKCLHIVAGHEVRNSFPVDSVLFGTSYPGNCTEMIYPGAHSDVGGGYQPGEGGRSEASGAMLSLIPLRVMHMKAREAGVPLMSFADIKAMPRSELSKFFALDDEGSKQFAQMHSLFQHYLQNSGSGGRDIGQEMLAHSSMYLRWKFMNINRNLTAKAAGKKGHNEQAINRNEPKFKQERAALEKRVDEMDEQARRAELSARSAAERSDRARMSAAQTGVPAPKNLSQEAERLKTEAAEKRDLHLREKAKLDSYANDSELNEHLEIYDARLIEDVKTIIAHHKLNPRLRMRPHYRNLVEAYKAEFVHSNGLRDEKIIAFFDTYVHDSLAGMAKDATLPSDPRVIYVGGDNKMRYAKLLQKDTGVQSKSSAV